MDAATGAANKKESEMSNTAEIKQKMSCLAKQLSTNELKAQAHKMAESDESYATEILSTMLDVLMTRIPETEFCSFCDAL